MLHSDMIRILRHFRWALLFGILGAAAFLVMVFLFVRLIGEEGTRIQAPGESLIALEEAGTYTIWNDTRVVVDGTLRTYSEELPAEMQIEVSRGSDGNSVPLRLSGSTTMETNGTKRVSIADFPVNEPGEYQIIVSGIDEPRSFRVSKSASWKWIFVAIGCSGVGVLCMMAAMVAGIIALIRCVEDTALRNQTPRVAP